MKIRELLSRVVGRHSSSRELEQPYQLLETISTLSPLTERQEEQTERLIPLGDIQNMTTPLPPIYSGIGLGVYQGEIVVFRLMTIGAKHLVMNNLRTDDLQYLPKSLLSDLQCLLDFLLRMRQQSSSLTTDSQMPLDIKLMRSYLAQPEHQDNLRECATVGDIPLTGDIKPQTQPQAQQGSRLESSNQQVSCQHCNPEGNYNQPKSTNEGD
jgi:hypothetical protein